VAKRTNLSSPVFRQFAKYGVVGVGNTLIHFIVYTVLLNLGVYYLVASTIGYIVGATNSYILNRRWTFRATGMSHATSAPRFALVTGVALAADLGLLSLFVEDFGMGKIIAQAVAIVIIVAATFVVNRLWSFSHRTAAQPTGR
jgi:putative flippase GtrA